MVNVRSRVICMAFLPLLKRKSSLSIFWEAGARVLMNF